MGTQGWQDTAVLQKFRATFIEIQRAELLKQECHTGKVASNIHRLGPKNTQKVANELKNNTHRGRREAPYCFSIHWQLFVFFGPSLCMLLATFPV